VACLPEDGLEEDDLLDLADGGCSRPTGRPQQGRGTPGSAVAAVRQRYSTCRIYEFLT
jgi:hypothetical protein